MRVPVAMWERMIRAVERGESVASVATKFEVSERGLRKAMKRRMERGTLEPVKPGPKHPTKLTPQDDALMLELIQMDPGITLHQICEQLSVPVAVSTVCRRLRQLGITLKKSP